MSKTSKELEAAILLTLSDRQVSTAEKRALGEILREQNLGEQQRAALRHEAFALVREVLADPKAKELLDWLEDINKLLLPPPAVIAASSAEAHFSPGNGCANRIIDLLAAAVRTVDVCVFTIADDRVSGAILSAHRRGVKVRIISDNDKTYDAGSDIRRFQQAGIPVRLDGGPDHMHHKFAIFDSRKLVTGSFNWTRSASDLNQENISVSDDPRLLVPFQREFDLLWQQFGP
jgi:phosphatidylserine/phosphatidylglycerophosphate/cardiolipin synthase-like enzyme